MITRERAIVNVYYSAESSRDFQVRNMLLSLCLEYVD